MPERNRQSNSRIPEKTGIARRRFQDGFLAAVRLVCDLAATPRRKLSYMPGRMCGQAIFCTFLQFFLPCENPRHFWRVAAARFPLFSLHAPHENAIFPPLTPARKKADPFCIQRSGGACEARLRAA
jgi:hypothetical protein